MSQNSVGGGEICTNYNNNNNNLLIVCFIQSLAWALIPLVVWLNILDDVCSDIASSLNIKVDFHDNNDDDDDNDHHDF